jgi:hypothetical protein
MKTSLSRFSKLGALVAMAALSAISFTTQNARANDLPHFYGVISARPEGNLGQWQIGGKTVIANLTTEFDTLEGALNVGTCAKVRYISAGEAYVADEIDSEPAANCNAAPQPSPTTQPGEGGTPPPATTPAPQAQLYRGVLNTRPDGLVGTWVIGGRAFIANEATELDVVEGALESGACVKVRFVMSGEVSTAQEIDSEPAGDCSLNATPVPTSTVRPPTSTMPSVGSFTAKISERPADGLLGKWKFGERSVTATNATEFKAEKGALEVGACAKVELAKSGEATVARKIESQKAEDCGGDKSPDGKPRPGREEREHSAAFALVEMLPAAPYIGTWTIGGVDYEANSETRFNVEKGAFAVGMCVKAEYRAANGVNMLKGVQTKEAYKCKGEEAGEPAQLAKAYGVLDVFTTTKPSTWVVSGITYTVPASASLEAEHGAFAVGVFVEVKYVLNGEERVALKIETHVAPSKGDGNTVGPIEDKPVDERGDWKIDGKTFKGDPAMRIDLETRSRLFASAAGAQAAQRVIVNYYTVAGVRYATSIQLVRSSVYLPAALHQ